MKTNRFRTGCRTVLGIAIFFATPWYLSAGPQSSESQDRRSEQTEMLENLLDMSPERLANTRVLIERLERMDDDERERLRKRVREFHSQTPEQIRDQRERWRRMSREERHEFREEIRELFDNGGAELVEAEKVNPHIEKRFEAYVRELPRDERIRIMRELRAAIQDDD